MSKKDFYVTKKSFQKVGLLSTDYCLFCHELVIVFTLKTTHNFL